MFKFIYLILFIIIGCGKAPITNSDHPPGLENYKAPVTEEIDKKMLGDWDFCRKDPVHKKSYYTKINIGSGIEVREVIYEDEYCQLIESTKRSSVISYYHFEKNKDNFKAKIIEKKLIFYRPNSIHEINQESFCGKNDWVENRTRDILGLFCSGMKRVTKYDVFNFQIKIENEKLSFNELVLNKMSGSVSTAETEVVNLINETDSEVHAEKGSKHVFNVYPPQKELFEIEVRTQFQTNLDQCGMVLNTYGQSLRMLDNIKVLKTTISIDKQTITGLMNQTSIAADEFLSFITSNNLENYHEVYKKISETEEIISNLKENYDSCETNCEETKTKINEVKKELKSLESTLSGFRISRSLRKGYERFQQRIDYLEEQIQITKDKISANEKKISFEIETYQKAFNEFSKIRGPLSHITFKSHWDENLAQLLKANPKLKFRHAPIHKVVMEYKLKDLPIYPASGSLLGLPINQAKELVKGRIKFDSFPKEIFGRANISLLAACPAHLPEDFGLKLKKKNTLVFEAFFTFN